MKKTGDVNESIAITRDIHWVGFYERSTRLHCNPYLLIDDQEAVLFDPGSIPDFPVVMRKVIDLVNPGAISLVVASHQDPDVCGNLAVVEDVISRPDLRIAAHAHTHRLIQHLALSSDRFAVDEHGYRLRLASGRTLEFVPMPFLHSPGAIATYDPKTRSLFSGDVFGALVEEWDLFAGPGFPENMASFHQAYMPSNAHLRAAIRRLRQLDIDRILPQHGSVIEGAQVAEAFDFLEALPCGLDLEER
ncbi:MAG: MBL fold metallo-hydrolase [Deltaproteobacteria bacterium]|nr:MAG: MBL fold metallo-hydrolase [Deltaproteobacteria bacterium]